jgi:hypothetical protein
VRSLRHKPLGPRFGVVYHGETEVLESLISHLELGSDPEVAAPSPSRPAVVMKVEMHRGNSLARGLRLWQLMGTCVQIIQLHSPA